MIFKKKTLGGWVNKKELHNGQQCKIVSEAKEEDSNYLDKKGNPKKRIVAKVKFQGVEEAVNVELNYMTVDALSNAFGEDSADWQGNTLTAHVESSLKEGKRVYSLYLIPSGFQMVDGEDGYVSIVATKQPRGEAKAPQGEETPEDDINSEIDAEVEKAKKLSEVPF